MNHFGKGKKTRLSRVYFVWTIREFGSAECKSGLDFFNPLTSMLSELRRDYGADEQGFNRSFRL